MKNIQGIGSNHNFFQCWDSNPQPSTRFKPHQGLFNVAVKLQLSSNTLDPKILRSVLDQCGHITSLQTQPGWVDTFTSSFTTGSQSLRLQRSSLGRLVPHDNRLPTAPEALGFISFKLLQIKTSQITKNYLPNYAQGRRVRLPTVFSTTDYTTTSI